MTVAGRTRAAVGVAAALGVAWAAVSSRDKAASEPQRTKSAVPELVAGRKVQRDSKNVHDCSLHNSFVNGCSEVKVFSGNAHKKLAEEIAKELGVTVSEAAVGRFADGEVSVKVEESVRGKDVYIVQPTSPPVNEHLMELLLLTSAMRHASAKRVTVIVPYFGYMRSLSQSVIEKPPEATDDVEMKVLHNFARSNLAARDVANMLEVSGAQQVISVDMYPPGQGMAEGFFTKAPVEHIVSWAAVTDSLIEEFDLKNKVKADNDLVVVSSHASNLTKAKLFRGELSKRLGKQIELATIIRTPTRELHQVDLVGDVRGKQVLVIEDLIDTGRTAAMAVKSCCENGATEVNLFTSHVLLGQGASERLQSIDGLGKVVALNTILVSDETLKVFPKLKFISIAPEVASLIKRMHFESK